MRLYSTKNSPLNVSFTDEAGQVIYKVSTPLAITGRLSTISRILPPSIPGSNPLQDRFGTLGTVEHHTFRSSTIRYGGQEIRTADYFRKVGWGWYGRHRAFIGPDGREYKWHLGASTAKLTLNDPSEALVAKFHKKSYGFIGQAHPPYLEIFPIGEGMVDLIVVQFVFIEKMRKEKEREAKRSHG